MSTSAENSTALALGLLLVRNIVLSRSTGAMKGVEVVGDQTVKAVVIGSLRVHSYCCMSCYGTVISLLYFMLFTVTAMKMETVEANLENVEILRKKTTGLARMQDSLGQMGV